LEEYGRSAQDDFEKAQNNRLESEQRSKEILSSYEQQKKEVDLQNQYLKELEKELAGYVPIITQVEAYQREIATKALVAKREVLKADEDSSKLEKDQFQRDGMIDKLNEQVKDLEDKLVLYEAQLDAQKKETNGAQEILQQAQAEMEVSISLTANSTQTVRAFQRTKNNCCKSGATPS
jgi:hypothetical protein